MKIHTTLELDSAIKQRAKGAVHCGYFSGVTSLSGLIDFALETVLNQNGVPKTFEPIPKIEEA